MRADDELLFLGTQAFECSLVSVERFVTIARSSGESSLPAISASSGSGGPVR